MTQRRLRLPQRLPIAAVACCAALAAATTVAAQSSRETAPAAPRAAVAAVPGSDATVVGKDFTIDAGKTGDATVTCPAGKRAMSGGVAATAAAPPPHQIQVTAPVDETGTTTATVDGDVALGWLVSVYNYGTTAGAFRAYAICSATSDATVEALDVAFTGATARVGGVATCPDGARAVGGGIGTSGATAPPPDYVQGSLPTPISDGGPPTGWAAGVLQFVAGKRTYTVFALCSKAVDAIVVLKLVPLAAKGGNVNSAASCPAGRRAVGGGTVINEVANRAAVVDSGPLGASGTPIGTVNGDVAVAWLGSGVNLEESANQLISMVVCVTSAPPAPKVLCAGKIATMVGTAGPDTLQGTAGPDVIAGLAGDDTITGLAGDDTICGGAGDDTVIAGIGNDTALGGPGDDTLVMGAGNDTADGGPGDDTITGGQGTDRINGGTGKNTITP